jgi:hypothetical protein
MPPVGRMGNRAQRTFLTGNSAFDVFSKRPGTVGNSTTFRILVAGTNTPASVTVTGSLDTSNAAVTFNAATGAGGASQSTTNDLIRLVNNSAAASPVVWVQRSAGSDGTGTATGFAASVLQGAT